MDFKSIKLEESKKRANYIKDLFAQNKFRLNESSHLGKLLKTVENSELGKIKPLELFDILDINRVYEALVVFETVGIERTILSRIRKGKLDFNDSSDDDGKNILFELEIATIIPITTAIPMSHKQPELLSELELEVVLAVVVVLVGVEAVLCLTKLAISILVFNSVSCFLASKRFSCVSDFKPVMLLALLIRSIDTSIFEYEFHTSTDIALKDSATWFFISSKVLGSWFTSGIEIEELTQLNRELGVNVLFSISSSLLLDWMR